MNVAIKHIIMSIPKTVYFNLRYLPFQQAIRFPIVIHWKTRVLNMKRFALEIRGGVKTASVRIGFPYQGFPYSPAVINITGKCYVHGKANIQSECELNISGFLSIGENFDCNQGTIINAKAESSIGDNVLVGQRCYFSDDDGHKIYCVGENRRTNEKVGYHIDDHVWITRECKIMKGCKVPKDCVVAAGAVVTKQFEDGQCILAGVPAKVVKRDIMWEK